MLGARRPGLLPGRTPFTSTSQRAARDLVIGAILQRQPFIALTGENGVGKTEVVEAVIASLGGASAKASAAKASAIRFVRAGNPLPALLSLGRVLRQIGGGELPGSGEEAVAQVLHTLTARRHGEDQVVLVVEEAETLDDQALAFLETLPGMVGRPAVQILFVGGPAFWTLLEGARFGGLRERITTRAILEHLGEEEVGGYVRHRLELVGWRRGDAPGLPALLEAVRGGEGNPSRINARLEQALRSGAGDALPAAPSNASALPPGGRRRSRPLGVLAGLLAVMALVLLTGRVFYRGLPYDFASPPRVGPSPAPASAPASTDVAPAPSQVAPAPPPVPAAVPAPVPQALPHPVAVPAAPVAPRMPAPPAPVGTPMPTAMAPTPLAPTPLEPTPLGPVASAPTPLAAPLPPAEPRAPRPRAEALANAPARIDEATTPEPKSGVLADRRVVIHYRADSVAGEAEAQSIATRLLPGAGSTETRAVADVPRAANIRYFFAQDEGAARDLASMLGRGGTSWSVRDFTTYEPKPRAGTIEVWIPPRS